MIHVPPDKLIAQRDACRRAANEKNMHGSGAGSLTDQRNRDNATIAKCKEFGPLVAGQVKDIDGFVAGCLRCGRPAAQH